MPRKAKTVPLPKGPLLNNVSLAFLQHRVAKLERDLASVTEELEQARMGRKESEAEESLEKLRELVRRVVPVLREGLGREAPVDDSIERYEAFRALDDLAEEG